MRFLRLLEGIYTIFSNPAFYITADNNICSAYIIFRNFENTPLLHPSYRKNEENH